VGRQTGKLADLLEQGEVTKVTVSSPTEEYGMADLNDGESVEMKGSGAKPYI